MTIPDGTLVVMERANVKNVKWSEAEQGHKVKQSSGPVELSDLAEFFRDLTKLRAPFWVALENRVSWPGELN